MDSALDSIPLAKLLSGSFWLSNILHTGGASNVQDVLSEFARKIGQYSEYAQSLSRVVREVSNDFLEAESSIAAEMQF